MGLFVCSLTEDCFKERATIKGKNLLSERANSFL